MFHQHQARDVSAGLPSPVTDAPAALPLPFPSVPAHLMPDPCAGCRLGLLCFLGAVLEDEKCFLFVLVFSVLLV